MARTVSDLLKAQLNLDGFTRENPESAVIGVAAEIVARNNPNRAALLIINLSTVDMFARPRVVPTANAGIRIGPGGGSMVVRWDEDFELPTAEWQLIANAAASPYYLLEFLLA